MRHNPDKLSFTTLRSDKGWRFLDEEEIVPRSSTKSIQCWNGCKWDADQTGYSGSSSTLTYRTNLPPEQLAVFTNRENVVHTPSIHNKMSTIQNPHNLTEQQLEPGYRFLLKSEIHDKEIEVPMSDTSIELWIRGKWKSGGVLGNSSNSTYRTKMSVHDLAIHRETFKINECPGPLQEGLDSFFDKRLNDAWLAIKAIENKIARYEARLKELLDVTE